ncbi:MAG: hypothetical protein HOP13_10410 [Alphaproteobacteria bacterium]|nr:hypothetical protein [Alphaproteobacteria bacterium]
MSEKFFKPAGLVESLLHRLDPIRAVVRPAGVVCVLRHLTANVGAFIQRAQRRFQEFVHRQQLPKYHTFGSVDVSDVAAKLTVDARFAG